MAEDDFEEFVEFTLPEPPVIGGGDAGTFDQASIDALFGGGGPAELHKVGLRAVLESEIINHERLPMLEVVCERMVRALSTSMRNLTSDSIDISLDDVTTARFGDFMDRVTLPAMIAVVRVEQWENYGIVTVDSGLIYAIVDALLGGKRGSQILIDGRDFTTIETALVARVLNLAILEFCTAIAPIAPVSMKLERIETNPRFAAIARPSNIGAVCTFRIDIDGRGGRFSMMFPQATIEPVRDKLAQRFMGETAGRENIWPEHMRQQMLSTQVELCVLLGEIGLTLEQVQALEIGQNLSFHTEPAELMDVQCGGLKLARVRAGQRRGNLAVSLATPVSRERMP
ncbi:MAG: flagellar motor switch protein FliM [Sphingobium sp.]|jgi:flagellar motor switch protein FliM|nr:flagellar motor switch protein FliM [Sphingobium sp.]MCI1271340.1 flagellar motor switch protein FliM [Sphingobium sp.]MCI1756853.1 flagellar motor switch protein FliM [Sphingobium sp.]MCI2053973.1 flagellar motor switch protein FliM [Sphingobium sp.]